MNRSIVGALLRSFSANVWPVSPQLQIELLDLSFVDEPRTPFEVTLESLQAPVTKLPGWNNQGNKLAKTKGLSVSEMNEEDFDKFAEHLKGGQPDSVAQRTFLFIICLLPLSLSLGRAPLPSADVAPRA